ncbi:dihydrodipicolinate synthase family protein [bacterium]|nr:dihydrodipicolinate synthase family protein [bacterium]
MKHGLWSRLFTFLPMPTSDDGETVNDEMLRDLIDNQIAHGIEGICVFGSTGGFGSFSEDEMKKATEIAVSHANGRAAVVAGTGARTTAACIRLTEHAYKTGCDGVLIVPASYWPLTQDEVYDHYAKVSAEIDIPICLYNNPWFTGFDMKPDFVAQLATLPNITCVKESSSDLTRITAIRRLTNDTLSIMAGWETSILQALAAGADSWASVCSNFVPSIAKEFFIASVFETNHARARDLWDMLFPLCEFISTKTHIRVIHTGLELLGWSVGLPRRPLRGLNDRDAAKLHDTLVACRATTKAGGALKKGTDGFKRRV